MGVDAVLFYLLAGTALASAVTVVAQRNPVHSALALIVTLGSLSGIFGLLGSPFIAVLQIIVYAGAIMVLFLFVLMLLALGPEPPQRARGLGLVGGALAAVLALQLGLVLSGGVPETIPERFGAPSLEMARVLFSPRFLYTFEAAAVLILAALVGSIVLAKKEL
jgi:NADH-quinone oxidoreductase subunit J